MIAGTPSKPTDRNFKAARHLLLASHLAPRARRHITGEDIDFVGLMDGCETRSEVLPVFSTDRAAPASPISVPRSTRPT
jgi:hypothetical protein